MEIAELERLVALLQNSHISELTLRENGARVTIRKTPEAVLPPIVTYPVSEWTEDEEYSPDFVSEELSDIAEITAPLVGFFRHVKPVVGLGAMVKQGQTIGIIEAMKLITEIPSPISGVVDDVCVEDAMPVEYGHLLFTIKPA
ncbi:MAG: hypothetical protein H7308_13460 [Chthonomonadaceae bacterium]|nr:hypothetical protein [Chthonomonadaceae bacterium]